MSLLFEELLGSHAMIKVLTLSAVSVVGSDAAAGRVINAALTQSHQFSACDDWLTVLLTRHRTAVWGMQT